ncbi:MAG: tRNA adenosine(34) deaminase TadA [Proteobacteria bacterium TMED261]|nr:MAG: tRNA adenosine(34) deaminase TadA [Proteobacteria bacterium TMED261]
MLNQVNCRGIGSRLIRTGGVKISRAPIEEDPVNDLQYAQDTKWMRCALDCARRAYSTEEVPIGAVLVRNEQIIGEGFNQTIRNLDPTSHAEIMAIRSAAENIGNYRLSDTTLYVTIEPCMMCLGAIIHARVERLVFGAQEPKAGVLKSHPVFDGDFLNHQVKWSSGILESECSRLMRDFFIHKRTL